MGDELQVLDLVTKARNGQKQAWDAIVERYSPLIWSICRRHQLGGTDAEDVGQTVWLQLVSQLGKLRDPAALPGWLATTTRRECGRVVRARCRLPGSVYELDAEKTKDEHSATPEHELLLAERNAVLREAFARLPVDHQRLLALVLADPPIPYAEISARLGIPVGSIGPYRGRCLDKLRRDPAVAALISAEAASAGRQDGPAATARAAR
jgi:RNA polymerase sigma factor (sigma-70 family)